MKRLTTLPPAISRSIRSLLTAMLVLGLMLSLLPAGHAAAQEAATAEVDPSLAHLDLNDDGQINDIDIMYVTTAWESRKISGDACSGPAPEDVNGDGCVDIADVQSVAGNVGVSILPVGELSDAWRAAAVGDPTFVVTTTSDASGQQSRRRCLRDRRWRLLAAGSD